MVHLQHANDTHKDVRANTQTRMMCPIDTSRAVRKAKTKNPLHTACSTLQSNTQNACYFKLILDQF